MIVTANSGSALTVSPALTLTHATPFVVADLTHNVLIRSSGTAVPTGSSDTGFNTAYVENLVTNAASFNVNYGEFAHAPGANAAGKKGVDFESARGSISSSTFRNGIEGIYLNVAHNNVLRGNVLYGHTYDGINIQGSNDNTYDILVGNISYNNGTAAGTAGFEVGNAYNNTLLSNVAFANDAEYGGIHVRFSNNNLLASNMSFRNQADGVVVEGTSANNTFIADAYFSNAQTVAAGEFDDQATGAANQCISCYLGYSTASVVMPGGPGGDVGVVTGDTQSSPIVLKQCLLNPTPGIDVFRYVTFAAGAYVLNYSTNPGVVLQVYGETMW